mgnify:CR=1 FL=1
MSSAAAESKPVAPVSPQYGLPGANLARLTHAAQALNPAAVYTEDAALFVRACGVAEHGDIADVRCGMRTRYTSHETPPFLVESANR